ncbi:hypothetical protein DM01DRAFT_1335127 [Hesseltinella vesiculosa]|uniref:TLC domain-containing protein n=1 Tax=Hesseltinella vesiculosa TaxID=101127 RepID=A0A1X2GK96_9FUNG|nr:hypothetical protein DM01DRAFT_1335127 [Hesseltinella vesiculosa]
MNISYPLYCWYCYSTSAIVLSFIFFTSKQIYRLNEKQRSWILTLVTSLVCSIVSLPSMVRFCLSGFDMYWLYQNGPKDIALVCFFQTYLILDLYLGYHYYRARISWLTGWAHHCFYLGFLTYLLAYRQSSFFVVAAILEVPTFILALGSVNPAWRSDRLFGLTFFALRLVFHACMIRVLKHHHHNRTIWYVALLVLPMHIYWFYGIVLTNVRKYRTKRQESIPILHGNCVQPPSKFVICA